jgi:hypothetical protein
MTVTSLQVKAAAGPASAAAATSETKILELLRKPIPVAQVCDATTWPRTAVRKLAARHGLLIHPDTDLAYQPDVEAVTSDILSAASDRTGELEGADLPTLLTAAAQVDTRPVRLAAERVTAAIEQLRERLIITERQRLQDEAETAVRQQAVREVQRLQTELASALQRARDVGARIPTTTGKESGGRRFQPGRDYDPKTVRAWARETGRGDQVPQYGRYLPDTIITAYLNAQQPTMNWLSDGAGNAA